MFEIELQNISKSYGSTTVLAGLDLAFEPGQFSVVLGSPVSGKSVLMRLIMGLESPDAGKVLFRGRDVTHEPAGWRNFGYVPQSFALYPHYRVFDNIAYPLALAKKDKNRTREQVHRVASKLKIEHLLQKFPVQLSGGEKQRVALARGMIKDSSVFILDDPLVGLDFKLREQLFVDLRDMLSEVEGSVIYTTSDPLETLALADRVYVLDGKRVIESGAINEVYDAPRQLRTLQLVGVPAPNLVSGQLIGKICQTPFGQCELEVSAETADPAPIQVGFRPEAVHLGEETGSTLSAEGKVLLREDLGAETLLYFESASSRLVAYWSNREAAPVSGDRFKFSIDPGSLHVFDGVTGKRLNGSNGLDVVRTEIATQPGAVSGAMTDNSTPRRQAGVQTPPMPERPAALQRRPDSRR
jgi:ABC-type sugar transport system ATPase subunit